MSGMAMKRGVKGATALCAIAFLVATIHAPAPRVSRAVDLAWAIPVALLIVAGGAAMPGPPIADPHGTLVRAATWVGVILGLGWVVEISVTAALPVPVSQVSSRDLFDDTVWALIAAGMVTAAAIAARRTRRVSTGVWLGAWAGLVSGLIACFASLALDTVLIGLVVRDPSEQAEFALRGPAQGYHDAAAYAARQTLFGSLFHLVFLGVVMGAVLGGAGAGVGTWTCRRRAAGMSA
jgi:hypothetical protein